MDVSASLRQDAVRARHALLPARARIPRPASACGACASRFQGQGRHAHIGACIRHPSSVLHDIRGALRGRHSSVSAPPYCGVRGAQCALLAAYARDRPLSPYGMLALCWERALLLVGCTHACPLPPPLCAGMISLLPTLLERRGGTDAYFPPYAPRVITSPRCPFGPAPEAYASRCSLPNRLARVLRGLTPAGPSSLLNRPDSRRFTPSLCPHRAHPGPPVSRDTGRAACGLACSFNSEKNETVLPEVNVRRTGTGKNVVLPD